MCLLPAAALLTLAVPAYADPPPSGWTGSFPEGMIVCHEKGQIEALVAAGKISTDELDKKIAEYLEPNDKGQHQCAPAYLNGVTVGESEDFGVVTLNGVPEHLWNVHMGTSKAEFWGLYEEKVEDDSTPA
jgi:hypothetical protein